jgi:surface protein
MYSGASDFRGDLSGWDVANVTDMSWMFAGTDQFNGGRKCDTVTQCMFQGAHQFNGDIFVDGMSEK